MRLGGIAGPVIMGLQLFSAVAAADEGAEHTRTKNSVAADPQSGSTNRRSAAPRAPAGSEGATETEQGNASGASRTEARRAGRDADPSKTHVPEAPEKTRTTEAQTSATRKRRGKLPGAAEASAGTPPELPPEHRMSSVTAAAVSPPVPGSSWLQLVIPDRYWLPTPPKLVLWLRGPYEDVILHKHEPLVLGRDADADTEYRHDLDLSGTPTGARIEGYMVDQRPVQACVAGRDCHGRNETQGVRAVTKRGNFLGAETTREIQGNNVAPVRTLKVVTGRQW